MVRLHACVLAVTMSALAMVSCVTSLSIGIAMSWGTGTHVTPIFDGLQRLATANHTITYIASPFAASFARDRPWIKTHILPNASEVANWPAMVNLVSRIEERVDTPTVFNNLQDGIRQTYETNVRAYLEYMRQHPFDLMICDFFDQACMDAATETSTKLAVSAPLGFFGVGTAWFVPDIFNPTRIDQWITSPWTRIQAVFRMAPVIFNAIQGERHIQNVQARLGFTKPFKPGYEYVQTNLMLAHNVLGIDPARSLPSNILPFGPIHLNETAPPLEPTLLKALDELAESGTDVVYIAFGTIVNLAASPALYAQLMGGVEALLRDGVAVVWVSKHHDAERVRALKQRFDQLLLTPTWTSQRRVLAHRAVRVFVSHGGYGSLTEGIYAGKPLLVLPCFGDQFVNSVNAVDAGIALSMDKFTFTSDEMRDKIQHLIIAARNETSTLAQQVKKFHQIAQIQSQTSQVTVANAVLTAATVGYDHLVPRDVQLSVLDRFPIWFLLLMAIVPCSLLGVCKAVRSRTRSTKTKTA